MLISTVEPVFYHHHKNERKVVIKEERRDDSLSWKYEGKVSEESRAFKEVQWYTLGTKVSNVVLNVHRNHKAY